MMTPTIIHDIVIIIVVCNNNVILVTMVRSDTTMRSSYVCIRTVESISDTIIEVCHKLCVGVFFFRFCFLYNRVDAVAIV